MLKLLKNRVFLGVLCLLLAGMLAFFLLPRLYKEQAALVEIVKLKQTVEYGTMITDDMLTILEVGSYGLPDSIVRVKTDIIGLVASSTIYAGEYLWRDRFITEEAYKASEASAGLNLQEGTYLVALSFPSASSGIAGVLRAGDIVDVYENVEDEDGISAVNMVLTSVNVYKVLNSKLMSLDDLETDMQANPDANPAGYDFAPAYVIFIVNEQQARTLIRLEKEMSLHLTLRDAGV